MYNGNGYSLADIVAATGNNRNNDGGWGGDGWGMWIWVILIFAIFGGWGNGFGGFGGNGAAQGALTRGELCQDMNFQSLESAVRGVQQGLCDGFYAQNAALNNVGMQMMQGFHGVDNAICSLGNAMQQGFNTTNIALMQGQNALQTQLSDCCCQTQRAIDGVNYNMATNTCNILNAMNTNTRDVIDNQNAGTRAILDYLCQDKISTLQNENQALRLAASQANQNAAIGAMIDASTAQIIRRTGNDCPIPAYVVPNPNCCYQLPLNNCNSGCGCA